MTLRFNVIHRPMEGFVDIFELQQRYAHDLGLRTTVLIQPDLLFDDELMSRIKSDAEAHGDEVGIWFVELNTDLVAGWTGTHENFLWLLNAEQKRIVIERSTARYRELFGHGPAAVGAYHVDATSMGILEEVCPEAKVTIAGCFEEGVKVFHGCNNSWYLFNEGMPWGPWWPSRHDSLVPAASHDAAFNLVALPHLSRDPALSYLGRNDFFATHPANLQRATANDGAEQPYAYNLVDLFRYQEDLNGDSYLNTFVGPSWLRDNANVQDSNEITQQLYRDFLAYLAELRDDGLAEDLTMSQYADWHREHIAPGDPDVFLAKEILYGSNRHYFWYVGPDLRVLFDARMGASIGDLRPYVGRVPRATGSDSPQLAMGSVPYLIQTQYRTGSATHFSPGSRSTVLLEHGGEVTDAGLLATQIEQATREGNAVTVRFTPARFEFASGLSGGLRTTVRLAGDGTIAFERELVDLSEDAELTLTEQFTLAPGVTEYPGQLEGIRAFVDGDTFATFTYQHQDRLLETTAPSRVGADFPELNTRVTLTAPWAGHGSAREGFLFNPYLTLDVSGTLGAGDPIVTTLAMEEIQ